MYYRRYRRRHGRSKTRRSFRKKPRSFTRKRYKKNRLVTTRLLRRIVPKPELKRHEYINGATFSTTNTFTQLTTGFGGAFQIPLGDNYHNREGNEIRVKMIQLKVELFLDNALVSTLQVDPGVAGGSANSIGALRNDQGIRFVCVDDMIDNISGAGVNGFPKGLGVSQQSNAPGGASDWWLDFDKNGMKAAGRTFHFDKKCYLAKGQAIGSNAVAPATGLGPLGMPKPVPQSKIFVMTIKYPGTGKRMVFMDGVALPISRPVIWYVGKNAAVGNNPAMRIVSTRIWFTDN